jgi:hypothetical protein
MESEQKEEHKQTALNLKELADLIGALFKVGSIAALILGGWGMLNYCRDNGIPFPAEIPTLIVTVGVVGAWLALVLSGAIFLPALGKEGLLGEEYIWLLTKGAHKIPKFAGYVGIPVALCLLIYLWSALVTTPIREVPAYIFSGVWLVITLVSVGVTSHNCFDEGERVKAFGYGALLTLIIVFWALMAFIVLVRILSWLEVDQIQALALALLLVIPTGIVYFLYKVMMPEEENKTSTRKKWGLGMGIMYMLLMFHPNLSGILTGYTLKSLKLGGGHSTVYVLRRDYCEQELFNICDKQNGKTVPLELMLDNGDRSYVRLQKTADKQVKEEKADKKKIPQLYMILVRAVVEQII